MTAPAARAKCLMMVSLVFLCAMLLVVPVMGQEMPYDRVADAYPKNEHINILHYTFAISLEDNSESIEVVATIDARYTAGGQNELRLDLIGASDAAPDKGMEVASVTWADGPLKFAHRDDQVFIDLGREIEAGELIRVAVKYQGVPAKGLIVGPNKHGDFTFFSDNWSSRARHWLATVDHPYDKATSAFVVTAPNHLQVVSNGLLVEETDLPEGKRLTHWHNSVPISTWLFALGAAEFAVQYVDTFEGKSIQTWVYRQDRDAGFYDFAVPTKQSLAFFSDLIGPFVYEKLANIQSNSVGGGMEAASSVFYGDNSVTGNRDKRWQHVIIHEIAHQWFGNAVTEYDWNHLWLSEGFATFYTLVFREYAYGKDDFIAGLRDARERVIAYYEKDYDFQIIRDELPDLDKVSGSMIYQKGAWTLHMLREMMGRDTYNAGVRAYYAEFINSTAHTADFRRHMEEVSGLDLRQFLGQWLYQGGIPSLNGSWLYSDGKLRIQIAQVQDNYAFELPVEFEIVYADGSTDQTILQSTGDGAIMYDRMVDKPVANVIIDPEVRLLAKWKFGQR
ncbi:MAG: M1 family metallopeptidase [Bacteroidota bacterium]